MNIAIDVIPIRTTGEMGGAFQTVLELIKGLVNRYKEDQYFLITAEWNHDFFKPFEDLGVKRILFNTSSQPIDSRHQLISKIKRKTIKVFRHLDRISRTQNLLKSRSIDVLFCPMSAINYSEAGVPIVSLIYDLQHEYYPQFFSPEELNHRRNFYHEIADRADFVACISEFTKQSIVEKLNFPEDRAEVIYISIQERLNKLNNSECEEIIGKFGLSGKKYIYYPANFWPHKNHRMLLISLGILKNKHPELDIHLCLTGSLLGKEHEFEGIINQMGLKDQVHHYGYVTDKEVAALLTYSNALIFPSLFEGFGIPIAEAMATGVPVLCSNKTSLPEVGGEAVIYFDPRKPEDIASKIYDIFIDENLQDKMKMQGYSQVAKFNKDIMIEQYYKLFSKAASRKWDNKYFIEGLYADGWSGKKMDIFLGTSSEKNRVLYAELQLPSFVPNKKIKLFLKSGNKVRKKISIQSGESIVIREELFDEVKQVSFEISATFIPNEIGLTDNRKLGIQVIKMNIQELENGNIIKTFI